MARWQLVLLCVALVPLFFGWQVLPLQDLPDWVFQAELFRAWLSGRLPDDYSIIAAVPPNALATVVLAGAASILGMDGAARALALIAAIVVPLGIIRLLGPSDWRAPRAWLPMLYGLSYPLLHGNLNSAIGLGAFLIAAAWLLGRADDNELPSAWLAVLAPSLLYVTHGIAYGMWLALVVLTPLSTRARSRLALGIAPSMLVALHYAAGRAGHGDALVSWSEPSLSAWLVYKVDTAYKQLAPFALLDPFFVPQPVLWALVLANWAVVASLIALAVLKVRLALKDPAARPSARSKRALVTLLFGAFMVAPNAMTGLVNPGERIVLPILALALSLPYAPALPAVARRLAMPALAAILAVQVLFIGAQGYRAGPALAALLRAMPAMHGVVQLVHESHLRVAAIAQRSKDERAHAALPRHYPLLRAAYYAAAEQNLTVPIFETGLFKCRVSDLALRTLDDAARTTRDILVVGEPRRVDAIAGSLPAHVPLAQGEYFEMLRSTGVVEEH